LKIIAVNQQFQTDASFHYAPLNCTLATKTQEMNIRAYDSKDEEAVVAFWKQCDLVAPWNDPHRDIKRKMSTSPELFLVGTISGQIVATIMGGYEGHRGSINYLAVSPEHQKKGLGKQMMDAIEPLLLKRGCPKINVMVRQTNVEVLKFYEAIGYKTDEVLVISKRLEDDE